MMPIVDPCPHLETDAGGNCKRVGCSYNSDLYAYEYGGYIPEGEWDDVPRHTNHRCAVQPAINQGQSGVWLSPRPVFTGELYRVVERRHEPEHIGSYVDSGSLAVVHTYRYGQPWTPARSRGGAPRTYTTLPAARSAATQLRNTYERYGIPMEVAVQRAPVGQWEVVG